MAVEPEDVGALADAIVHGAEERLVADLTRALVDGLADGIIGGSQAEALEALARANRARLDQILAEHASKVSGEVRSRTLAALERADARDVSDLEAYYGAAAVARAMDGASAAWAEISHQTALGLAEIVARQNIAMAGAAERLWYEVAGDAIAARNLGVDPLDRILARAVCRIAAHGVETIDYKSGIMSQIDVAVRRHVVSQASQAGGRMTLARLAAIGHDLVITSAHYGARPSHAEWQGRPCCVSGPKLVGGVQYPGLIQLTGYGGVGGLKGVNCRHSIGPYYPGVTELPDLSFPRESGHFGMTSEECYEAMQRQRELERRVRGTKREIAAMEQAGIGLETPRYAQKRLLLGRQQQTLRKHCEESGLVRNYPREKAYGVGAQPRALRAAAKAKAAGRYRHPASQERIDALASGALAGVRFSAPPTYNGRIRTPGLTKVGYDGDGRKYAGPVYIGKQAKPGDAELVDTILHEELEARIWLNRHGSERYWRLNSAGDDERHAYIQKIIDRYVRMKGIS